MIRVALVEQVELFDTSCSYDYRVYPAYQSSDPFESSTHIADSYLLFFRRIGERIRELLQYALAPNTIERESSLFEDFPYRRYKTAEDS
jgi:hypothetical protein